MIAFIVIKADSVNGLTMDRKTRSDSISHLNTIFILVQIYENTGVPDHILWVSEMHIFSYICHYLTARRYWLFTGATLLQIKC